MKCPAFAGALVATALSLASFLPAHAASQPASMAPGYRPALNSDEGGIWAVMDKEEVEIKVSPALVTDPALNAYVRKIVCDLAGDQCSSLRVYIVDDPTNNAFTAANGMVVVWTGLLIRTQNEAQLAFVLGHEITHYLRRHALQNFERLTRTAGSVSFLAVATAGLGGLVGLAAIGALASYTRDQEREADAGGFDLAVAKGYDPRQGAVLWANVAEQEDANPNRAKPSAYLASHPATKERLATLEKRAAEIEKETHADRIGADELRAVVAPHRSAWLEEEFNRGDYAQSVVMIRQLLKSEPQSGEINYFLGEAHRRRNAKGDAESAIDAYRAAIAASDVPPAAYRGLGLVALKQGSKDEARDALQKYLDRAPDARDRATVQYYLTTIGGAR